VYIRQGDVDYYGGGVDVESQERYCSTHTSA
jgi:hypothetical protein